MSHRPITVALGLAAAGVLAATAPGASAAPVTTTTTTTTPSVAAPRSDLTPAQRQARAVGVQLAPKGTLAKAANGSANPFIALVPDARSADYATWRTTMAAKARQRAVSSTLANARRAAGATAPVLVHDEQEPAGTSGSNDTQANAERITGFGTGARQNPRLRILGDLPRLTPAPRAIAPGAEDNGSIPLATPTGITGTDVVTTTGRIGDGPHGSAGSGSGDFDVFALQATAGQTITVDTRGTTFDTLAVLYNGAGELIALDDDAGGNLTSLLRYRAPTTGTYYAMVSGFFSLPDDPFDSGSGFGAGEEGDYTVLLSAGPTDADWYSVDLRKGDVIGSTVSGSAGTLSVFKPNGIEAVTSPRLDATFLYAPNSPLPGGGNTALAYVTEESGRYAIRVDDGEGRYDTTVEVYRPGTEIDPSKAKQTVFLDFDGARVNTGKWGGPGVRTLSPFNAFIARWGLTKAQEATLINRITAEVRENIKTDPATRSIVPALDVTVVSSRTSPDVYGQPNVIRVIIGGTIEQSGIPTIGIAQYIDPGNYGHEDDSLVLLDVLSEADEGDEAQASGDGASLNTYLEASSDRVGFVSRAIGNIVSHEIGHTLGNYHTDSLNTRRNVMDEGGCCFGTNLYAVGPDRIGGTADDPDRDFITDTFSQFEGFLGNEDTLNVTAWAYAARR